MSYSSRILSLSPVFYFPLNAGSLSDASGHGYTLAPRGGGAPHVFVSGGAGAITDDTAVEWGPGSNVDGDALSFATASGLPVVAPYTYEMWVRFDQSDEGTNVFGTQVFLPTGTLGGGILGFFVENDMAGNVSLAVVMNDGTVPINVVFSDGPLLDHPYCWHYHAFTYDGTTLRWYFDGVLQRTLVEPAGRFSTSQTPSGARLGVTGPLLAGVYANHVAGYATALSGSDIAANYAAATPRQDDSCFLSTVRLKHASGQVCWSHNSKDWAVNSGGIPAETHDGSTFKVYSGAQAFLQVPFPVSPGSLTDYLGMDPVSGLPMSAPLPALTPLPVPIVPTVTTTCVQVRCGAAVALTKNLLGYYSTVSTWANAAISTLVTAFFDAVGITGFSLLDFLTDGLATVLTPSEIAMVTAIDVAIGTVTSATIANIAPTPTDAQVTWLQNAAFDSVTCVDNKVQFDGPQMDAWYQRVLHAGSPTPGFAFVQQEILYAIIGWGRDTSLSDWATVAQTGAQSPDSMCDAWS